MPGESETEDMDMRHEKRSAFLFAPGDLVVCTRVEDFGSGFTVRWSAELLEVMAVEGDDCCVEHFTFRGRIAVGDERRIGFTRGCKMFLPASSLHLVLKAGALKEFLEKTK